MKNRERTFFCIDMKTYYASVECAERGLNPFETNLVVADEGRGKNALCLAVSPRLKALGVKNRCRLSEIPQSIKYIIAPPQMALYIEYAADIYSLYLNYFAPEDMHVYSIDESFIDATDYLKIYKKEPISFVKEIMNEIAAKYKIPSTAGVGTNLYLAKIALDITAKHARDHVGFLTEEIYRKNLWNHEPITDFWMVAAGTAKRLEKFGVYTMRGITELPTDVLYKAFGVNAELLIDHAWGREPCLIEDIKNYRAKTKSVSFSQILPRDYSFYEARTVMREMVLNGCAELIKRKVITGKASIFIGYTRDIIPSAGGRITLTATTNLSSFFIPEILELYDKITDKTVPVRRLGISFENVCDEGCEGYDLFTDFYAVEREKTIEKTVLGLRKRFGKNTVMRGVNYLDCGTQIERNGYIGGHRAGNAKKEAAENDKAGES